MEVDANDSESASEGIVNAMHVIRRVMTLICDSINEVSVCRIVVNTVSTALSVAELLYTHCAGDVDSADS